MTGGRIPRLALGSLVALVGVSVVGASAAANTVPPTNAGQSDTAAALAQLAPPECAGMGLTRLQVGPGGGGGGNALILGDDGGGTLSGGGGDDCIVGASDNFVLNGQGGNDVLIGGQAFIVFLNGGGGSDECYGNGVIAIPTSCEVFVP
jgi:Ca2+-binding RTX toxin-like protein